MKYVVTLNGKNYEVEVEQGEAIVTKIEDAMVPIQAAPVAAAPVTPIAPAAAPAAAPAVGSGEPVKCPMPGTILAVNCSAGQAIKSGQVLVVLEAMKMENEIVAPRDATVSQVLVSKGDTVNTDDVLIVLQ